MALVNIDTVQFELKRYLKSCPIGGGLEIMSYKRNRTVAVILKESDRLLVIEKGYQVQEFEFSSENLSKKLKPILKREFPRSRKLRLFKFKDQLELERIHQKI